MKSVSFCLLCAAFGNANAASKAETDLQAKLAQAQAELAASVKEKAILVGTLAKVTAAAAATATTTKAAGSSLAAVEARQSANASTADANAGMAQQAVVAAATVAAVTNEQVAQAQRDIANSHMTLMITQIFGFLAMLVGILYKGWAAERQHQWDHEAVLSRVAEVQKEAQAAYAEANTVNLKLANIGVKMADGKPPTSPERSV